MITTAAQATVATTVTVALRDLEQIKNMKKIIRNNARLSRDTLYNLHEFAYDYSNFIHQILTFPDLSIICYNPAMMMMLILMTMMHYPVKYNKLSYHKQVALCKLTA